MKIIVVLIFSLMIGNIFAQSKLTPLYYLNSEEIDLKNVYIRPSGIDDIKVDKKTERGAVYITTKKPLTFLTLDMILKKETEIGFAGNQVVYRIDDKIITDKSKVKVDDSYFIEVKIQRLDEVTYIDDVYKPLILVEIQLLNKKTKPVIRIRGDEALHTETRL